MGDGRFENGRFENGCGYEHGGHVATYNKRGSLFLFGSWKVKHGIEDLDLVPCIDSDRRVIGTAVEVSALSEIEDMGYDISL